MLDEPAEMVADARLPGFVAEQAGDDPVLDVAAHAGDRVLAVGQDDVAGRRAHDHDHPARLDDRGGRRRDVGIDIGDRHRRAGRQAGPGGSLVGQPAGSLAHRPDVAGHLLVDDVCQPRVERGEVALVREAVPLRPHRLVAGRARVPGLRAGQPPDDPVGGLDQAVRLRVDLGRLVEDLQRLREEPLGGDPPAVPVEPRLPGLAGDLVDPVGLGLRGVVLPELDPGMRIGAPSGEHAQRRAIGLDREHRAGREVDPEADDVARIGRRLREDGGNGLLEDAEVVLGILERPIRWQANLAIGQGQALVDHAVAVRRHGRGDLLPVGNVDQDGAPGLGPEVDPDRVPAHRCSDEYDCISFLR